MKTHYLAVAISFIAFTNASIIEIKQGGFSVETDDTSKEISKSGLLPENVIFPRIVDQDYFLDSVFWNAPADHTLQAVLDNHQKDKRFEIIEVRPFTTSSGIDCLRYELKAKDLEKPNLHRLLFRNANGKVVCVGMSGNAQRADQIFSSISTIKVEQGAAANP